MRFENAAIPLTPRSITQCLDLAVLFAGRHLRTVLALWLVVAVPSCLLVYYLVDQYYWNLLLPIGVFYFASSQLGVLLISGVAPNTFGVPFEFGTVLNRVWKHGIGMLFWGLGRRIAVLGAAFFCLIPAIWVAVQLGFSDESKTLSKLHEDMHDRRTSELIRGEILELSARAAFIMLFCGLLWLTVFLTLDFASTTLFAFPILFGRLNIDLNYLPDPFDLLIYIGSFFWNDPRVLTAFLATGLLVYPIGRLAWFFCYIDLRVRRDCWDMELRMSQTARNLEAKA